MKTHKITIREVREKTIEISAEFMTDIEATVKATEGYISLENGLSHEDISLYTIEVDNESDENYDRVMKIVGILFTQHSNRMKGNDTQKKVNRSLKQLENHIKEFELNDIEKIQLITVLVNGFVGSEIVNQKLLSKIAAAKIPSVKIVNDTTKKKKLDVELCNTCKKDGNFCRGISEGKAKNGRKISTCEYYEEEIKDEGI